MEATDVQTRMARDELYEEFATSTIVATNGHQRYFRAVEHGRDVLIRHSTQLGRYRILDEAGLKFIPAPPGKVYTPDTTRPFTENDLLRDATWYEATTRTLRNNVPGALAGTGASTLVGAALVALTPLGPPVLAAGSLVGAKIVVGGHVVAFIVAAHPVAATVAGGVISSTGSVIFGNVLFPETEDPDDVRR